MPSDELSPQTVYVLGAGFSSEAKVPLQDEILDSIRKFDISDAPGSMVDPFLAALGKTSEFLDKAFGSRGSPSLEDVFTLLDQAVDGRQYYLGYSWRKLYEISRALSEAILYLFNVQERKISQEGRNFYELIAAYLIQERLAVGIENDPFSVISLNWDCVLDSAVYRCLDQCRSQSADIDYCCYSTPVPESKRHFPSITQKSRGLYNIKIMKLHGSTNWMLCPNCNRLYTGLGTKDDTWIEYILGKSCPRCGQVQSKTLADIVEGMEPPRLEPFLITPTFVKKFENPHIKMVWHNAYIDLCEAEKVVFIGYSLREADYHLRTLFKRAIRPDAKIEVILAPSDKPAEGSDAETSEGPTRRYSTFFGIEKDSFDYSGVKGYFTEVLSSQSLDNRIESLKKSFASMRKSAEKPQGS